MQSQSLRVCDGVTSLCQGRETLTRTRQIGM